MTPFNDASVASSTAKVWPTDLEAPAGARLVASGAPTLDEPKLRAIVIDFPVDLVAAASRIQARATIAFDPKDEEAQARLKKIAEGAPAGSIVGVPRAHSSMFVFLAQDLSEVTFVARRTWSLDIHGPLEPAPPAKCLPGQPCAQQADQRRNLSASVGMAARYVVSREGMLVSEDHFELRRL